MKKLILCLITVSVLLALCSCGSKEKNKSWGFAKKTTLATQNVTMYTMEKADVFSYISDMKKYADGQQGVKTSDLKNTNEDVTLTKLKAIELAINEVGEQSGDANVYYDPDTDIWKVQFSADCIVYISGRGITARVVNK